MSFRASAQCVIHPEDVAGDMSGTFNPYTITGPRISTLECDKSGLLEKSRDELLEQVTGDAYPDRISTADIPDNQYLNYIESCLSLSKFHDTSNTIIVQLTSLSFTKMHSLLMITRIIEVIKTNRAIWPAFLYALP